MWEITVVVTCLHLLSDSSEKKSICAQQQPKESGCLVTDASAPVSLSSARNWLKRKGHVDVSELVTYVVPYPFLIGWSQYSNNLTLKLGSFPRGCSFYVHPFFFLCRIVETKVPVCNLLDLVVHRGWFKHPDNHISISCVHTVLLETLVEKTVVNAFGVRLYNIDI